MPVEQGLEPCEIDSQGKDQQEARKGNGESPPGQREGTSAAACEHMSAAGNKNKEDSDRTGNDGQGQEPAREELPYRKGEKVKGQALAEDRVHDAACGARRVPIQGENGPLRHRARAG